MYSPIEGNVAVGNIALIGRWSYRSAQVARRHARANYASCDAASRDARWWSDLVRRSVVAAGVDHDNHVVYCYQTPSGRILYVQCSDGYFYFGWSVNIGVW